MTCNDESMWGMSPHTTGLLIGWICLIIAFVQFCYVILLMRDVPTVTEKMLRESINTDANVDTLETVAYTFLAIYLCALIIDLAASILLIVATQRSSHLMMLPWLIVNGISIVFKIVSCFYVILMCLFCSDKPTKNLAFILFNVFLTAMFCWMWMVILALYVHLRDKQGE